MQIANNLICLAVSSLDVMSLSIDFETPYIYVNAVCVWHRRDRCYKL